MNTRLSILLFAIIGFTAVVSCKKTNYAVPSPPKDPPFLNVVNATADTLDYFINGTRRNNQADIYPTGATYYLTSFYGTASFSFKKAGSPVTLFTVSESLDTTKYYTMFVAGESAAKTFMVHDTGAISYNGDTSSVRFVNASANATTGLDIIVGTGNVVNIKNSAFKYSSLYVPLRDTVNEIKVYATGSTKPLVDTLYNFIQGQSYTVFTKGYSGGTGNSAPGVGIYANLTATYNY